MTTTTSPTERVGRYQLLEPIGIGPTGAVSRAKVFGVAGFERQFAVKRFHAELTATAAMAAMLSAAARAYGSLEHPRIARMSEFGVAQGSTFTAVEYVPGLDALRLIAEVRLATGSGSGLVAGGALALVSQAARAVGYAHGRGLTHLGLAPTNVIVTADGDIKITDFGILSATLPQRPIDVPRLAQRIPYLAPEQLANEATSAATDVFALGVLAYELVTGTRTFKGDTPQQVAQAIMAGPPAEPPLPRPIVRVLQRCLARSPFERFPDARALADALDAALRVAPVPGTRKDIGAQVKETLDRLSALNEGQMSGVVALHLGTGPIRRFDDEVRRPAPSARSAEPAESSPYEIGPADPVVGPAALAAATISDLPRTPMTTVPGLAPPPIPVPPGLGPPSIPPPPGQAGSSTLLGMGKNPPSIPAVKARPAAGIPPVPAAARRAPTRPDLDLSIPVEPAPAARPEATVESAVHLLDPSDLEPVDSALAALPGMGPVAADDVPAARVPAVTGAGDAALPGHAAANPASDPAMPLPALSSADDFMDAPTHAIRDAHSAAHRIASVQAQAHRLAPSSVDARPVPPVTLEPSLFDPIVRPDDRSPERHGDRPSSRPISRPSTRPGRISDASAFDDEGWDDPVISRGATVPVNESAPATGGSGRIPNPAAEVLAAEARSGRTILGMAAPPILPRAPTPPPVADLPVPALGPEHKPDDDPDPISEMALEGFRATPAPIMAEVPAWPGEPGELRPEEVMPAPIEPSAPPAPAAPALPAPAMSAQSPPGWITTPPPPVPLIADDGPPRRRATWILVGMLGAAVIAVAGWQVYTRLIEPPAESGAVAAAPGDAQLAPVPDATAPAVVTRTPADATAVAVAPVDASRIASAPADATAAPAALADASRIASAPADATAAPAAPADASRIASAPADATQLAGAPPGAASDARAPADAARVAAVTLDAAASPAAARDAGAPSDAARVAAAPPGPPNTAGAPGDRLAIASTPPGARVFLDGADSGVTPLTLPGSPDRHTIALLLAGHELYITQVDGHGTFQIPLKEVTPTNGPAGIKVLRCKDTERYYVFVDGKPTGQTCPTERIGCELGPHTVEVYDVVSETRRKWDIVVKDTRLSFRVRVE